MIDILLILVWGASLYALIMNDIGAEPWYIKLQGIKLSFVEFFIATFSLVVSYMAFNIVEAILKRMIL